MNAPGIFLPLCFVLLLAAGWAGALLRERRPGLIPEEHKEHFSALEAAVLGMLALLLGFTFSMAMSRYDTRQRLEVDEANAIGTTWLRTSFLPEPQRSRTRTLLHSYVDVRVRFFSSGTQRTAYDEALHETAALQRQLWQVASDAAEERRDAVMASYISSLNEMIDLSEKRTEALENRIPPSSWALLMFFSLAATFIVGLAMPSRLTRMLLILPVLVSCALTLVMDLDAPRSGWIHVQQNSMERVRRTIQGG